MEPPFTGVNEELRSSAYSRKLKQFKTTHPDGLSMPSAPLRVAPRASWLAFPLWQQSWTKSSIMRTNGGKTSPLIMASQLLFLGQPRMTFLDSHIVPTQLVITSRGPVVKRPRPKESRHDASHPSPLMRATVDDWKVDFPIDWHTVSTNDLPPNTSIRA
jgi:hypothetical protein